MSASYKLTAKKSHTGLVQTKETIEKRVSKFRGDKHFLWKGDDVGYVALHNWVRRRLGTPRYCAYCEAEDKLVYHWANISHAYKRDLSDWIRLCVSCHSKYDRGLIEL